MNKFTSPQNGPQNQGIFYIWGSKQGTKRSYFIAQALGLQIEHIYIPAEPGRLNLLKRYLGQSWLTLRSLLTHKPRWIFVQNPPIFLALWVYLYSVFSGAKFVIDSHTDALTASWWAWSLPLHRFLSRRAAQTIVTNRHLFQTIAEWSAPAFVLSDTPPDFYPARLNLTLQDIKAKIPFALPNDSFTVVMVSSASYDEPIREVIAAMENLPTVRMFITGDLSKTENGPEIMAQAPFNIQFTGYLDDDAYFSLLQAADVVMCLTTQNHTMQSGASEALWLGTPIITSDWPFLQAYFHRGAVHVDNTAAGIEAALQTIQTELGHYQAEVATWQAERWADWQERIAALSEQMHLSAPASAKANKINQANSPKLLMVLGDGGHSTEMFALIRLMGNEYHYSYMINENDLISEANLPFDGPVFKVPMILGKYKVYRNPWRVLRATWHHLKTLWQVRPEAIISSGASIAIPVSVFGRFLGVKVIFVETGSRVFSLSGTGKVMYHLADKFFVQWEPLTEEYPKAIFAGRLL